MENPIPSYQIPNGNDPTKPFTFLSIHNAIKLNPTNYLSWKLQIEAILAGHDLLQYVDGTLTCPPSTTTTTDGVQATNSANIHWHRQDRLLFGALIGTLNPNLVPLVSQARTSKHLWNILSSTYALPSRGHIKQLKEQLSRTTKGNRSVTEFMQSVKTLADHLDALGKKVEHEDLIDRVLLGLDESYTSLIVMQEKRELEHGTTNNNQKLL